MRRAVMPTAMVISRPVLDSEAVAHVHSGRSHASVQVSADRFLAHPVAYTKVNSVTATHSMRSGPADERARATRGEDQAVTMP
ncbi:hypothetical protein [Streptomyces pratensis]|uniref:hypothetical protein n=1 Tax=Streptomyces pratensis TaxID=1169025 RepID=UPI001EE45CFC|nr:hypothetical protein [Streptomyces pratensis]